MSNDGGIIPLLEEEEASGKVTLQKGYTYKLIVGTDGQDQGKTELEILDQEI